MSDLCAIMPTIMPTVCRWYSPTSTFGQEPPGSNKCSGRMIYKLNMHLNLENSNVVHFCKNLSSKAIYLQGRVFNCACVSSVCQNPITPTLAMDTTFHFMFKGDEISYSSQYKANWALALLNHRMRATGGFHFQTYTLLFNQLEQPIIMTNARFWGHRAYQRSPIYNTELCWRSGRHALLWDPF